MHHVPCELKSLIPNQIIPKEYAPLIHLSHSDWFLGSCLVCQSYTTMLKKKTFYLERREELRVGLGTNFIFLWKNIANLTNHIINIQRLIQKLEDLQFTTTVTQ